MRAITAIKTLALITVIVAFAQVSFAQSTQDYSGYEGYGSYQSTYQVESSESGAAVQTETQVETQVQTETDVYGNYGASADYQGRVQETQSANSLEKPLQEYLDIKKSEEDIREYNKKKYDAYQIVLNNNSPHHIELLQAQVTNGLDEQFLATEKAQEKKKKKRGFGAMMKAASIGAGVAGHFVPYGGAGSWAAHTAINQSSYVANSAGNAALYSANADGNVVVTGQYVKQVNNVVVTPGNKMSFQVVVPKGSTPSLAFIVKDLTTNQIVDVKQ